MIHEKWKCCLRYHKYIWTDGMYDFYKLKVALGNPRYQTQYNIGPIDLLMH